MKNLFLTAIVLFFSFSIVQGQTAEQNQYNHKVLGFRINYPKTWISNTVEDYYANLDRIKLQSSEFDEMIKKSASVPFFFISKYKEPYDDINPSIKINTRLYGNLKGKPLSEIMNMILPQFEKMFADFKVEEGPVEKKLNEINCTYVKFFYTMKNKEGREFKTCSEMYMIDKGDYYYMIGVGTKQDESNCKRQEITDILKTMKFD